MDIVQKSNPSPNETASITTKTPESNSVDSHAHVESEESGLQVEELQGRLPPTDRGFRAWAFMASAFLIEVVTWGFPFSFGTFQSYYSEHEPFNKSSPNLISSIGTVAIAIMFLWMPLVTYLVQKWPYWSQVMRWIGVGVASAAIFICSFCDSVWQLLLLQGIIFGVMAGSIYAPLIPYLSEWFIVRRNLATGIMFAGTGTGGTLLPILFGGLLDRVGYRWTMRIWSFIFLGLSSIGVFFSSRRFPRGRPFKTTSALHNTSPKSTPNSGRGLHRWRFLLNGKFQLFNTISIFWALGFFPVPINLPLYVQSLGYPLITGTVALAVYNLSQAFSFVMFGYLGDRYSFVKFSPVTFVLAAVIAFLVWGLLAHNLAWTFVFSFLYPFVIGGNASTWPAQAAIISRTLSRTNTIGEDVPLIISTLGAIRGLAAIVGPIIANEVYQKVDIKHKFGAYGFGHLILLTACSMAAAAGLSVWMLMLKRWEEKEAKVEKVENVDDDEKYI